MVNTQSRIKAFDLGRSFTIALDEHGDLYYCGKMQFNGTVSIAHYLTRIAQIPWKITSISAGFNHVIALTTNGTVTVFGGDVIENTAVLAYNFKQLEPENIVYVAAGSQHSIMLSRDGEVYTLGMFPSGDGSVLSTNKVVKLPFFGADKGERAIEVYTTFAGYYVKTNRTGTGKKQLYVWVSVFVFVCVFYLF